MKIRREDQGVQRTRERIQFRLRIDADTHKKLGDCAVRKKVSMSELVREAIEDIVRREKEEIN